MRGTFIVLEGIDGAGKTTQAARLARWLRDQGIPTSLTEEPHKKGAVTPIIRAALHTEGMLPPESLALLFAADRMEHCKRIASLLDAGMWVVCDRYVLSNYVYQSEQGLDYQWLKAINRHALVPDFTLFLDVPILTAEQRIFDRGGAHDTFETPNTLSRVRNHYIHLCMRQVADDSRIIPAHGDEDAVAARVSGAVRAHFAQELASPERTPDGITH